MIRRNRMKNFFTLVMNAPGTVSALYRMMPVSMSVNVT